MRRAMRLECAATPTRPSGIPNTAAATNRWALAANLSGGTLPTAIPTA